MVQISGNNSLLTALTYEQPAKEKQKRTSLVDDAIPKTQYTTLKSNSSSIPRLEKHIDDYRNGYGNLSKDIAIDLAKKRYGVADALSVMQPDALSNYSGYLTVLDYGAKARFVTGIDRMIETSSRILNSL